MSTIRIAVASTPLTATLDEAVPAAVAAIDEAARLDARIVCLPETGLPGHRCQSRHVPEPSEGALGAALSAVADAARRTGVVTIVGAERKTLAGREIMSVVFGGDGTKLGEQVKDADRPVGGGRLRCGLRATPEFTITGVTFEIAICHEAFDIPRSRARWVLAGAQLLFVPHYVTTEDGSLPKEWCAASNPYNEKALLCRALENTIYVAASNTAGRDQGSASCIISPPGALVASVPYGPPGVVSADIDLDATDRRLACRWAPERSLVR